MAAFAWPEVGHEMINVFSQVPPNQTPAVPPNATAASYANQIVSGSLTVTSGSQPQS